MNTHRCHPKILLNVDESKTMPKTMPKTRSKLQRLKRSHINAHSKTVTSPTRNLRVCRNTSDPILERDHSNVIIPAVGNHICASPTCKHTLELTSRTLHDLLYVLNRLVVNVSGQVPNSKCMGMFMMALPKRSSVQLTGVRRHFRSIINYDPTSPRLIVLLERNHSSVIMKGVPSLSPRLKS